MTPQATRPRPRASSDRDRVQASTGVGQRGIAILLVVACLAIMAPLTISFNYQARVDWQGAMNVRDEVAARQIERGAMQLSLLLFEIQKLVFNQKQFQEFMGSMDITQVAPYLMSVFGTQDGAEGLGALAGIDTSALSDLALRDGMFEFRVYAESGKINVNCLGEPPRGANKPAERTVETLEALMAPQIYDPLFEEEKSDGQFYTRQAIIQAMADYVDEDARRFNIVRFESGSAPENYRYQELADPYRARDGRLDSIDELHLVEGIDDDWMAAFAHELTTYGQCKVNLNFASPEQIALVLRHGVTEEDRWKTEGENFVLRTMPLANFVVEYRQFNLFESYDEFAKLVAKPEDFMGIAGGGLFGGDTDDPTGLPLIPDGIEVVPESTGEEDVRAVRDVATVRPERVYTVEVVTTVGNVNKRLTAVYDMQYARAQSQGQGAWLYIRED